MDNTATQFHKRICFILLLAIPFFIGSASAQSNPENCEEARKKYLEQNTDVAKAKIDPWNHYQSYGKKEGRKWPDCGKKAGRLYSHDCLYESQKIVSDGDAFSSDEDVIGKYEKITKKYPVVFNDVNGNRVCSVFYFSKKDRVVHRGEFTENQLSQEKAYKFQRLIDCLEVHQMIEEVGMPGQVNDLGENGIHVRTDLIGVEVRTVEDAIYLGKSQGFSSYFTLEKLKNKYLTISITHPACVDTVVELDKRGHFVFVRMKYTTKFLQDEFNEFRGQSDLKALRALHAITMDDKLYHQIVSCADSIEVDNCLKQGSGLAIEKFISDRPYSPRYQDALKVRQYYKDAEAKYTSAKSANTIKEYEYFLKNFGLSNHNDEVKQLLVAEAVRYYSKDLGLSDSLLSCYKRYVVPNQGETWIEQYDKSIKSNMESVLIAENKSATIDQFANHWKKILLFEHGTNFKMNSYRRTFREYLSNLHFEQLKKVSSASSQDSLVASFKSNFESFEEWADGKDDSEDFINHVMTQTRNKNGSVNLFNSSFLVNHLVSNVAGFSRDYKYKGVSYSLKKASQKAGMAWNNNKLVGDACTYDKEQIESIINFTSFPNCDVTSFYQNGNLVVEKHYSNGTLLYIYEFADGVNISINALTELVNNADKLFAENKLEEAGVAYASAMNKYPTDLPINVQLAASISKYNTAREKHLAEKKAEEEAAANRQKPIDDANAMRRNHGKTIKERMIAALTIYVMFGEAKGEEEYNKVLSEIQNGLISREFTNEDNKVINSLLEEATKEFETYVSYLNATSGSSSSSGYTSSSNDGCFIYTTNSTSEYASKTVVGKIEEQFIYSTNSTSDYASKTVVGKIEEQFIYSTNSTSAYASKTIVGKIEGQFIYSTNSTSEYASKTVVGKIEDGFIYSTNSTSEYASKTVVGKIEGGGRRSASAGAAFLLLL